MLWKGFMISSITVLALDPLHIREYKYRNGTALRIASEEYCFLNSKPYFREDCKVFMMHIHKVKADRLVKIVLNKSHTMRLSIRQEEPQYAISLNEMECSCHTTRNSTVTCIDQIWRKTDQKHFWMHEVKGIRADKMMWWV